MTQTKRERKKIRVLLHDAKGRGKIMVANGSG